ncbi:FkbM family methyltransferase [Aerosakkonema funiforme]|uniref:FkbM family methyltransferase n=1 Tax=Aerosakkonema funiforme TaxID=1246630 RepID=UPI0035BA3C8C
MPAFLPSLKQNGHLERIHITVCIVGSRKIEGRDDYGSQGWDIFAPNLSIYGFDADPEACEQANADIEARQVNWTEKHIPLALWNCEGSFPIYVTNFPGCSSLYPPNESYLERFQSQNLDWHKLVATVEIETTTLDNFCATEGINEIDFLQLDVQGAEKQVLEGGIKILEKSIISLKTEVEFNYLYVGQPLFSDIDIYLRDKGFRLFDLSLEGRAVRKDSLISSSVHPGTLFVGNAFYFRDLVQGNVANNPNTPEKMFKLACIADMLEFTDYALEILAYLTRNYGNDENYNFAREIVESLSQIPPLIEKGLDALPIIVEMKNYLT